MPALSVGFYHLVSAQGDLLLFLREYERNRILVGLNLGEDAAAIDFDSDRFHGQVIVSSLGDRDQESIRRCIDLRGGEGLVIALGRGGRSFERGVSASLTCKDVLMAKKKKEKDRSDRKRDKDDRTVPRDDDNDRTVPDDQKREK